MLISVRQLIDRTRHPRSRADELARLRARYRAQPSRRQASDERVALAKRLRVLRAELSEALGEVDSCKSCAKGHPLPAGRWHGGHCCGSNTLDLFTADEVAALKLGGTHVPSLEPPKSDHAGCVFRGPTGCSLEATDRPTICVLYICTELRKEVLARPGGRALLRLAGEAKATFSRFVLTEPE